MKTNDEIFKFYGPEELSGIDKNRYSHFGWEGNDAFAFETLAIAYKNGADAIFEKITASKGDYATIDTLVYPLCFMHRHCMEILIKYLFVKYFDGPDNELKKFLNSNHNLNESWRYVKPLLSKGKKKVGTHINIGALEHYIKEMADFDPLSMRMRYPVNKNLDPYNSKELFFDIYNFHDRMNNFFDAIFKIDYDIDNQIKNHEPENKVKLFLEKYRSSKDMVIRFIEIMSECMKNTPKNLEAGTGFESFLNGTREQDAKYSYLNNLSSDDKIIIETLFCTGGYISEGRIRLAKSPEEKIKEFVTICLKQMYMDKLEFGKDVSDEDINIYGKNSLLIVSNLQTAIGILKDGCI